MFVTEWALFWQSLPCPQVAAAAAASRFDVVMCTFTSSSHEWLRACFVIVFSTRCRRPPVRTSVLKMSKTTSWNVSFAAAHHDASFSLKQNRVDERALSYRCCCSISLFIIAAALLASTFGLMRYSVNSCSSSFGCCCGVTFAVIFAAALLAFTFSLLCYVFNKSAFCSCSCCGILCIVSCVMCFFFFFGGGFFLS